MIYKRNVSRYIIYDIIILSVLISYAGASRLLRKPSYCFVRKTGSGAGNLVLLKAFLGPEASFPPYSPKPTVKLVSDTRISGLQDLKGKTLTKFSPPFRRLLRHC